MPEFYGLPTQIIENRFLHLEYLVDAGPRIVRLCLQGSSRNLLAETPDFKLATPHGDYTLYGGHRLWRAPEISEQTHIPDDSGLTIEKVPAGVRLSHRPQLMGDVYKSLELHLHDNRAAVKVIHELRNDSQRSIECAPWAITQLIPDGIAILPLPAEPAQPNERQPNRLVVLWPYSHWNDDRLHLQDNAILIEARSGQGRPEFKLGALNRQGWIAYLIDGVVFRKSFEPPSDQCYPDLGSNVEVYCNDRFIELETLGGLQTLQPGQTATHVETWEMLTGLDMPTTLAGAQTLWQASQSVGG